MAQWTVSYPDVSPDLVPDVTLLLETALRVISGFVHDGLLDAHESEGKYSMQLFTYQS